MWKDGTIRARTQIKKYWKLSKWSTYYWMNYLDENYKSKVPWKLLQLVTFKKPNRMAKVMVYDNCIAFDINYRDEKNHSWMNVDWNDEEIIEWVKLTKRWKLNILWACSFVISLGYTFVGDKIYEDETEEVKEINVYNAVQNSLF